MFLKFSRQKLEFQNLNKKFNLKFEFFLEILNLFIEFSKIILEIKT